MNVAVAIATECSLSSGPGKRFTLWVRQCLKHCVGCLVPEFQKEGRQQASVSEIVAAVDIAHSTWNLEGITLTGGEPFLQAEALAAVCQDVRKLGLSVVIFTGYTLDELESVPDASLLLAQTDLLVAGPYDLTKPSQARHWVASENKEFHFLTDRYESGVESVPKGEKWVSPRARVYPGKLLWTSSISRR